jgi:hypothetical protein
MEKCRRSIVWRNSIPHVVLTDKDGVIIAKNLLRGEELDKKLKELFNNHAEKKSYLQEY